MLMKSACTRSTSRSKLVLGDLNERGLMDLAAEVSDLGGCVHLVSLRRPTTRCSEGEAVQTASRPLARSRRATGFDHSNLTSAAWMLYVLLLTSSEAVHARCDVTSWESQLALFDLGFSRFGAIDAVLPNAGVALGEGFVQKTETGARECHMLDIASQ